MALDTHAKKMNPPSIIFFGGGGRCLLIAYYTITQQTVQGYAVIVKMSCMVITDGAVLMEVRVKVRV